MHANKRLYGTATVGTKGQVVIPATAREEMNINTGDRLYVIGSGEGGIVGFIKEDQLAKFVEKMSLHLEELKNLKQESEKIN